MGESLCRQVEGTCTVGTEARHRSIHQHAHAETGNVDKRTPNMRRRLNECKTQQVTCVHDSALNTQHIVTMHESDIQHRRVLNGTIR